MTDMTQLWSIRPPWLHLFHDDADVVRLRTSAPITGAVAIELDGGKMRDVDTLFREFAREFRFPEYFGWNWPAYAECLTDLEWFPARAYLVTIEHSQLILEDDPDDRETFFRILSNVCSRWARSFGRGPEWGGGEVPFNVALLCEANAEEPLRQLIGTYL